MIDTRTLLRFLLLAAFMLGLVSQSHAQSTPAANRYTTGDTYLQVEVADTDLDAQTATLAIRWDASWRDAETWDAAWIVLKGQRADKPLVPLAVRATPTVVANRSSDGADAAFQVTDDRVGFFVRRAASWRRCIMLNGRSVRWIGRMQRVAYVCSEPHLGT